MAHSPRSPPPRIRFLFVGPWVTLHASFRRSVTLPPLRFTSLAVACSGEDLHLQVGAHAGRTMGNAQPPAKAGVASGAVGRHLINISFCARTADSVSRRTRYVPDGIDRPAASRPFQRSECSPAG